MFDLSKYDINLIMEHFNAYPEEMQKVVIAYGFTHLYERVAGEDGVTPNMKRFSRKVS